MSTHTHTLTAPPLREEPEDNEASESSSDDEKGGTISMWSIILYP